MYLLTLYYFIIVKLISNFLLKLQECVRWMNQIFSVAKNANNVEFQGKSLSILARLHIKLQQWTQAQSCLSNMRSLESRIWEKNILALQLALHQNSNENITDLLNDSFTSSEDIIQIKTIVKIVIDSGTVVLKENIGVKNKQGEKSLLVTNLGLITLSG